MKKKNITSKEVLGGALIGAAVGVTAGIVGGSKAGKKIGHKIEQKVTSFYKYLSPELKRMKNAGESEYKAFVKGAVEKYGEVKKLSTTEVKHLAREAAASWDHIKNNL
jgi:gas vesicle protein